MEGRQPQGDDGDQEQEEQRLETGPGRPPPAAAVPLVPVPVVAVPVPVVLDQHQGGTTPSLLSYGAPGCGWFLGISTFHMWITCGYCEQCCG